MNEEHFTITEIKKTKGNGCDKINQTLLSKVNKHTSNKSITL